MKKSELKSKGAMSSSYDTANICTHRNKFVETAAESILGDKIKNMLSRHACCLSSQHFHCRHASHVIHTHLHRDRKAIKFEFHQITTHQHFCVQSCRPRLIGEFSPLNLTLVTRQLVELILIYFSTLTH